ncbi:hypothetical protein [Leisingera sp. M658]|uniref:hypothetical protein n=1 Tax=Leisingera sp. M658 TaxID=2867015 RepID=UPI0021A42769|nr:hypothetical protein [Leisingera sp. M658]UWQ77066.1 hypothetical protein K3724_04575 [Leisingera sp. M658]
MIIRRHPLGGSYEFTECKPNALGARTGSIRGADPACMACKQGDAKAFSRSLIRLLMTDF